MRPITLVYGQNSAGKSSIIDALVWAAHMGQEGLPKEGFGDSKFDFEVFDNRLRLGRFDDFVHGKNPKAEIELRFSFGTHEFRGAFDGHGMYLPENEPLQIHIELKFTRSAGLNRFRISTGPSLTPLVDFESYGHSDSPIGSPHWNLENQELSGYLSRVLAQFIRTLSQELRDDDHYGLNQRQAEGEWRTNPITAKIIESVLAEFAFYRDLRRIPPGPLAPYNFPRFGDDDFDWPQSELLGEVPDDALRELIIKDGIEFCRDALHTKLAALQNPFRSLLENTLYLGPLRETFDTQKLLLRPPTASNNASPFGSNNAHKETPGWNLSQEAIRFVNSWLQKRATPDTNYHLRMVKIKGQKGKLASARRLQLIDKNRGIEVGFNEVGSGIGQFLPVLLAAAGQSGGLICVKQPELHLHPSLQSDIADIFTHFVHVTGPMRGKAFVIETHSEHLLLRIMRRMRETAEGRLPKGKAPVLPSDISVIYVENIGMESIVREMPLNEKGELVRDWPGGFFEEGLREVLY